MSSQASSNPSDDQPEQKRFYVNFNQDNTSLCIGDKNDWKILDINDGEDVRPSYKGATEEVYIIEKLFASSLVAVVTVDAPRMLKVRHYKRGTEICNYTYASSILNVKMNRQRLCVVLRDSCHIHDIHTMTVLHTIGETPPNNNGLCDLSWGDPKSHLLAYPSSITAGYVQIFDTSHLVARITIKAHESPLVAMTFNPEGTLLATASVKGTLIRIHNVMDGTRVVAFRRGLSRCVNIHSLRFSTCGRYVGASSNTETVHIYKLPEKIVKAATAGTWTSYFSYYLPTRLADSLDTERDFATTHLPVSDMKKVIGIKEVGGYLRLLVATEDGFLFIYNIDKETGMVSLSKKINLINDSQHQTPSTSDGSSNLSTCTGPTEGPTLLGSYAGIVKGNPPGQMSESDKMRVVLEATAVPPKDIHLNYEQEYPPLAQD
ncbi:WD repeat domain phosphoinositide-interacting protein 2-like isoform X2 [Coccinella septempunctata]|uniref:WD repeat domain phosphoinositide-interacting protein 2-like isoform X2 n=1 Tax=Coccinella septempunctata TaxID=41139 RepID=UPI001D06CC3E|nr:WD repeat domain phosphoinositide-interacting protein 2-like isoform X2 [Coccinella septempunctata]